MLPVQIPSRLRKLALFLPETEEGEGVWLRDDALAVIESLKGTTLAVSDIVVFGCAPWGYVPLDQKCSIPRLPNEPDTDYAQRSRLIAADFIRRVKVESDQALFAMSFTIWKDAA